MHSSNVQVLCEQWYIQYNQTGDVHPRLRNLVLGDEDTGHSHTLTAKDRLVQIRRQWGQCLCVYLRFQHTSMSPRHACPGDATRPRQ
jgi:hypothetical protein